mmetsp:Transcript_1020/g.1299  ORF Transcript_1020/g.1299 Transcript_1020/m.1299 type:complete len:225 (-) Transcript_1020:274-948(-)
MEANAQSSNHPACSNSISDVTPATAVKQTYSMLKENSTGSESCLEELKINKEMPPPPPIDLSMRPMNDTTLPKPKLTTSATKRKVPKANPRLRPAVGVRKGFGMLDWMQLTNAAKDLAGRKGAPLRNITMEEVRQHRTQYDAWTVWNGKVYNITPYLHYHPGGLQELMKGAGRDCTALFNKYHPWVNVDNMCGSLLLGYLEVEEPEASEEEGETSLIDVNSEEL